jgi:hypothetical protein
MLDPPHYLHWLLMRLLKFGKVAGRNSCVEKKFKLVTRKYEEYKGVRFENGDCVLVVDVWLHRVDEYVSGLTFEEWDPSADTDASEAPVAMIVNSSELRTAGFDLREVLQIPWWQRRAHWAKKTSFPAQWMAPAKALSQSYKRSGLGCSALRVRPMILTVSSKNTLSDTVTIRIQGNAMSHVEFATIPWVETMFKNTHETA